MARIVQTVAPMPRVHIDKNVHHCQVNKSASCPLTLFDLYGSLQGHTQILHWITFTRVFQGYETKVKIACGVSCLRMEIMLAIGHLI